MFHQRQYSPPALSYSALISIGAVAALAVLLSACSEPGHNANGPQEDAAPVPAEQEAIETRVSGEDAVNALNGVFGRHAGERGSHAKGFCVIGSFTPDAETPYSYFSNLEGNTVPIQGRFSIGGGNPAASDKGRSVRGMAIRLLPDTAESLDLVMISAPVFFAATPKQFVDYLTVRVSDPETGKKNAEAIAAFNQANPNVLPHINFLTETPPPASYATTPYYSTHAFFFEQNDGETQAARWHFEPVTGFQGLTPKEEEEFPTSFLQTELEMRLAEGAAEWVAYLQPAQEGDNLVDPSAPWSGSRDMLQRVGHLQITGLVEENGEGDCTGLLFDPNNLPSAITPSDDPILALRREGYAVSFLRRSE